MIYNPTFEFNPTLMNQAIKTMASVLGRDIKVSDNGQNFAYGMFVAMGNDASEDGGVRAFYKLMKTVDSFARFDGLGDDLRKMFAEAAGTKFDQIIHALNTLGDVQSQHAPAFDEHPHTRYSDAGIRAGVRGLTSAGSMEFAFEAVSRDQGDLAVPHAHSALGQHFLYVTRAPQGLPDDVPRYSLFDPDRGNFANLSEDDVVARIGESRSALTGSIDTEMKQQHPGIQFEAVGKRDISGLAHDPAATGLVEALKSAVEDVAQFVPQGGEFLTTDNLRVFEYKGLTPLDPDLADNCTRVPQDDDIEVTPRVTETFDASSPQKVDRLLQGLGAFGTPDTGLNQTAIRLDPVPGAPMLLAASR
ncbi:hypothetical protein PPN31114_02141 [Pandoraea pneumonica]|uniref:Uncharacterized protein n=1 Tax=Pandoraea pneumonica TaxID=2508299 RepID=A0A5E4UN26_9BURK|nr:hypothetical protein PPN31114_02141 [Pandoraea pneumonica]